MSSIPERALIIKFGGSSATTIEGANFNYLCHFLEELFVLLSEYQRIGLVIGGGPRIRQLQAGVDGNSAKNMAARQGLWEHAETLRRAAESAGLVTEKVPHSLTEVSEVLATQLNPVVVVSWLADGQSTDTSAITLAELWQDQGYEATVVILSNVARIFSDDPRTNSDVLPIATSSIKQLVQEGVLLSNPADFRAGMNVTIDPVAVSKLIAMANNAPSIFFTDSTNTPDVKRVLQGKKPVGGTVLKPDTIKTTYGRPVT